MPQKSQQIVLDPKVWGPHFWFVLHSITITYPEHPNEVTKRKYYDFIHNLPLFLPNCGGLFAEMLDKYPVTPYLDCRESFVRWMVFIHNKYNNEIGNEVINLMDALDQYYELYEMPEIKNEKQIVFQRNHILAALIIALVAIWFFIK